MTLELWDIGGHCDECYESSDLMIEYDNGGMWESANNVRLCENCLERALQMIRERKEKDNGIQ